MNAVTVSAEAGPAILDDSWPLLMTRSGMVVVAIADRRFRGRLTARLRRGGYRVCEVSTGPQVLSMVEERPLAAVIMDWLMAGENGVDVCARLRRNPALSRLPVMLMAARGDRRQVAEGFGAGADEVLTRPFDAGHLVSCLDRRLVPLR